MHDDENLDGAHRSELAPGADDARVIIDFAVGPSGVGPVMGFDSDDFFPAARNADTHRDGTDGLAGGGTGQK